MRIVKDVRDDSARDFAHGNLSARPGLYRFETLDFLMFDLNDILI